MILGRERLLAKADEFEEMANRATSDVIRCRYRSMARYWSILADETAAVSWERKDTSNKAASSHHAAAA